MMVLVDSQCFDVGQENISGGQGTLAGRGGGAGRGGRRVSRPCWHRVCIASSIAHASTRQTRSETI
jgi:hypothetical protein